jgi:ribosome-associated protein
MVKKKKVSNNSAELVEMIVKGIREKQGKKIVSLQLGVLPNTVCEYFVICHANSRTQVEAIADAIEHHVKTSLGYKVWHREGFENSEWLLLDYADVVVHIFQEETRDFYRLETLWADAGRTDYAAD